ncbi:hypothetical protein ACBP93_09005 [Paenalcaligenes hominis]|uniref:DUF58 domain-containing protein n=1 Tax=Paenalcaligenes hominis TaxID=643674 RepID=A0ABX0WKU0_9BURK|nr:hypothetical protein [Paenalcaligenes hominis]NJB63853.1 hypothetical protein [Paenalcaligenes hominis]GGE61119.1 hypothetical protein GCM10007278_06780 [Paenalcaligenes hominis]
MVPRTQHFTTRTPLRVRVLGLLFLVLVLGVLGLLSQQWHVSLALYLGFSFFVVVAYLYQSQTQLVYSLSCNQHSQFYFTHPYSRPVHITHVWQSSWAVCLRLRQHDQPQRTQVMVFWRSAQSVTAWRYLHIHVLRYQLQHNDPSIESTV